MAEEAEPVVVEAGEEELLGAVAVGPAEEGPGGQAVAALSGTEPLWSGEAAGTGLRPTVEYVPGQVG